MLGKVSITQYKWFNYLHGCWKFPCNFVKLLEDFRNFYLDFRNSIKVITDIIGVIRNKTLCCLSKSDKIIE